MKEDNITINGIEYVKKDNKTEEVNAFFDACKVCLLVKVDEFRDNSEEIKVKLPNCEFMDYKFLCELQDCTKSFDDKKVILKDEISMIDYQFISNFYRITSALGNEKTIKKENLAIFCKWNKEKKQFVKDEPVLFVWGDLGYIVAPRVEEE